MPYRFIACVLLCFLGLQAYGEQKTDPARVLIVVSGHGVDGGKTRPGFEMDELSQTYLIFHATYDAATPRLEVITVSQSP